MYHKFLKKILASALCLSMSFSTLALAGCNKEGDKGSDSHTSESVVRKIEVVFSVPGEGVVEPDPQEIEIGGTVTAPADPVRAGYDFGGWYTDEACTEPNRFSFGTPVTEEMTTDGSFYLYAKWNVHVDVYTVSFDYNDGSSTIVEVKVTSGQTAQKPADPQKDGARFGGWYLDSECMTPYNADEMQITSNRTVYAKWINLCVVTFQTNGGTEIAPETVDEGTVLGTYTTTRPDYIFSGWFTDEALTVPYTGAPVTASMTLYAKWASAEATQYIYTFYYNYEGAPAPVEKKVVEGAYVETFEPTAEGKIFKGWYTSAACETPADLSAAATADVSVYAKWVDAIEVRFDYNYTNAPAAVVRTVEAGSVVAKPVDPVNPDSAYSFAGWSSSAKGDPDVTFTKPVSAAVTYYAQWNMSYVFEAEDLDLDDFYGFGFSGGGPLGTGCIFTDESGDMGASNGHYVTCLNNYGTELDFTVASDRAIKGVKLILRLSAEIKDISIGDSAAAGGDVARYDILVNDKEVRYGQIDFVGVPPQGSGFNLPFADYEVTIDLKAGENHIRLVSNNQIGQGGTMNATAPMVDCLKITTYAGLNFTKKEGNY